MQKVLSPRLIVVIVVSLVCVYLTLPTLRYFVEVSRAGNNPTAEQTTRIAELRDKGRVIKLGLDLQGGVDFLLAIDLNRLKLRSLENDAEALRTAFNREDIDASTRLSVDDPENMSVIVKLNDPKDLDLAADQLDDEIKNQRVHLTAAEDIRAALQASGELVLVPEETRFLSQVTEAMEGALKVVRRRVDEFGLTQPVVTRSGQDRIKIQIPGETNPQRIRESLLKTASLEFRLLHPQHDQMIVSFIEGGASGIRRGVGTGRIRADLLEEVPSVANAAVMVKRIKRDISGVPSGYVLRLGRETFIDPGTGQVDPKRTVDDLVYLVKSEVPVGGDMLRRAAVITDPADLDNPIKVTIDFNSDGANIFARITTDHTDERFAIILDDLVYSAPNINEPITGGRAQISGGFTQAEARDLSLVLKAGALPAPLQIVAENTIGPTLGADSIRDSGKAIMIGGVLIMILMVTIYSTSGIISIITMTLNLLLILAILSLMNATLTLSGVGGILLTMGMAVDANVLIYERLREELDSGKPLRAAVNVAFGRALTVILDSNITSLLPALVLVLFEVVDGSMKGFWLAIAIGLIANLYTGVVVTRTLMEAWYAKFKSISVGTIRFLKGVTIPWMKYRIGAAIFTGLLTLASIGVLIVDGLGFGIDFTGGVLSVVEVKTPTTQSEVAGLFNKDYHDVQVIKVLNKEQWQITVPQTVNPETKKAPTLEEIRETMAAKIRAQYGDNASILSTQSVDPFVGGEFRTIAILSLIITCAVILTYLAFQFQWIFGMGAVAALVHDVFLSLGIFRIFGHSLTLDIVSALLIILGYSVNDTIVVFDRIRERMQDRLSASMGDVFNAAINETLSRTLLTGGSTMLAILVMYIFGGSGLSDFALILLLGVGFGTYSSIFVASSLVYVYMEHRGHTTVLTTKKATARVAMPKAKA